MISEVVMPQMGADMVEGTIVRWLKHEGDPVKRGEIIAEIETDKANVEIEAFESGIFRKSLAAEGDVVPVGGVIAVVAGATDDISKYTNGASAAPPPAKSAVAGERPPTPAPPPEVREPRPAARPAAGSDEPAPTAAVQIQPQSNTPARAPEPRGETVTPSAGPSADAQEASRLRISPVARRVADGHGIDARTLHGSGPDGRIIRRDVEAAIAASVEGRAAPTTQAAEQHSPSPPPSKMRQAIARRMSQSKREAPHYYLLADVDMTEAVAFRKQINDALEEAAHISINDLLVRATALALRKHPDFNATISGDAVTRHERQNVCVAIALDDGLIAPAILDAGSKSLSQMASASKDLVARAKGGALRADEIAAGTFTITNLGAYGIETLIGIIQPPQTAILGAGSVAEQAAVRDGVVVPRQMMKLALSADHRVTDGAQGARFLVEIRRLLETPVLLVV